MHSFCQLVRLSTEVNISRLNHNYKKTIKNLESNAATSLVVNLQSINLQKIIYAVGTFSIFEAVLQSSLNCKDGFKSASKILKKKGEYDLERDLSNICLAINVLKHGRGRSYDLLVHDLDTLPFRIKKPDENFFNEGDVSEISALIEVDDDFLLMCADVIFKVSVAIGIE